MAGDGGEVVEVERGLAVGFGGPAVVGGLEDGGGEERGTVKEEVELAGLLLLDVIGIGEAFEVACDVPLADAFEVHPLYASDDDVEGLRDLVGCGVAKGECALCDVCHWGGTFVSRGAKLRSFFLLTIRFPFFKFFCDLEGLYPLHSRSIFPPCFIRLSFGSGGG